MGSIAEVSLQLMARYADPVSLAVVGLGVLWLTRSTRHTESKGVTEAADILEMQKKPQRLGIMFGVVMLAMAAFMFANQLLSTK